MSRVINPDSAGKQRTQLIRAIVLAVRELARQTDTGTTARDLAAFISIALQTISDGVEVSVVAWEKRDYWVKADKFRMEWAWAASTSQKMRTAVLSDDWASVAMLSATIAQKFSKVQVSENNRLGKPWVGSFKQLTSKQ
ncbi:MAG: hypothetical protein M1485_07025 [Chloroflexi bacterium]|nr:hypothetical protein [Chloroflexota bacterium]MCL5612285.1 hypothetical protein [Chloroflexota bacterium]